MRRCLGTDKRECYRLIEGRSRCPQCTSEQRRLHGYSDRRWRETARRYKAAHPICEVPDCLRPSVIVHHLYGIRPRDPGGYSWKNLRALCRKHHAEEHAGPDSGLAVPEPPEVARSRDW